MLATEQLSEPVIVHDIFVSGLANIEALDDGLFRLTFFAKQRSPYGGDEYVITCRMIATLPAMLDGAKQVMLAAGAGCCETMTNRIRRH